MKIELNLEEAVRKIASGWKVVISSGQDEKEEVRSRSQRGEEVASSMRQQPSEDEGDLGHF